MIYTEFQNERLSMLGFGAMRLPTRDGVTTNVDEEKVSEMVDYAIKHGVNYFDTARPYHAGVSEVVMGRILNKYPRDSYYFATKYPGHQQASEYDPAATFADQLEKCGMEYFDFYLLHNVCENSFDTYNDPKWNIINYFVEQKREGKIRHLGFSSHGRPDFLRKFLDMYGEHMEFCQIQLNYMDFSLQNAEEKCRILAEYGIPVWVMEPVRGGKLAQLPETAESKLKAARPDESVAAWAFRWLQGIPNVKTILSGMSTLEQVEDNVRTFSEQKPLSDEENQLICGIAEGLKNSLPCTGCRYCCDGCPMGLDIPLLISAYNDLRFAPAGFTVGMQIDSMPEDKRPEACIGCGACAQICPQSIDIPSALRNLTQTLEKMPSWADVCKEREEAAKKLKNNK
ncbi:MAG: aldo/keto reductase [Eubacteriales bacterium]